MGSNVQEASLFSQGLLDILIIANGYGYVLFSVCLIAHRIKFKTFKTFNTL